MTSSDISAAVTQWTQWAATTNNQRYDIALLKIWIQFEKFVGELFVSYAIGGVSETGYSPTLKVRFCDEEHLNAFLRDGNRTYIDYLAQVQKLSKHIFTNNPFDVIFADATNNTVYGQVVAIRNYIAHESGEAKSKMIKTCFGGNDAHFMEPQDYLLKKERSTNNTYYTFYTEAIKNMAVLLASPPN